jgi:sulfite dehydrogenase (quinone) subunit SoeC
MKPYNWMVQYTPQASWIERRGLIIWLSMYAGILGGGAYLASLFFNSLAGMFISWLIVLFVKGGLHIAHAERPLKLWRMILRPQTSWISRGLILTACLILFGAVQLILTYTLPGTAAEAVFKVLAGIAAFGVVIYAGFTMSYVGGIPFWNVATLPVCFVCWGLQTGAWLVLATGPETDTGRMSLTLAGAMSAAIIVVIGFYLWTATYEGDTARESVKELIRGSLAAITWVGVLVIGLIVPLILAAMNFTAGNVPVTAVGAAMLVCSVIGGLSFTFIALKAGVYRPIVPSRY